jgi:diguanylate cyclase (GGDEF)-like protein
MISVIFALQHFFGLFFDGLSYLVFGVAGYSWSMMMIHVIAVILMAVAIIVQIRTRQTLFEESETDHLTKALNRRAILRKIREFHEQEPHAKGSLIFFDLDHFKKVNDTYGHEAGDELLIEFAKVIKEAVCEEANVARYGGEEFVIFLPYCDTEQAVQSAEELRKMIETTDFFVTNALAVNDKKLGIRITSSIGVANYPDHSTEIDDLIRYADRAMYVGAKMTGRNQVSLFDPTM